jgi:hypothetical protein
LLVEVNDPDSSLIIKIEADTLYGDPVRNQ